MRAYYRFESLGRERGQAVVFYPGFGEGEVVAEGTREAISAALRLLRDQAAPLPRCKCGHEPCRPERHAGWEP